MSPNLNGQVALITGGAKNLGAQLAYELAAVGASLALHYNSDKTKEDADKLALEFQQKYPSTKIKFYQGDLTTKSNVDKLFDAVLKDFGGLNIVVNTVGMVLKKPITEISEDEYDTMFAWVVVVHKCLLHY
jgi:NAD(P)-dependent dehydrogenase (short-subunit alcohol dehydrogenase family)